MPETRPGQATQIEVIADVQVGRRPVGSAIRHFKCTRCIIVYSKTFGPNDKTFESECPLCRQELKTEQMRQSLQNTAAKVELLERQNNEMEGVVNLQKSFRDALDLIDDEDRAFIKTVLYQWRMDKSVTLKVTHNAERRANGFLADYRQSEPEARQCTSIGGMAIAAYYDEALRTVGSAQAMQILLRAAQHLLPGATR